jgi:hypothetical protein
MDWARGRARLGSADCKARAGGAAAAARARPDPAPDRRPAPVRTPLLVRRLNRRSPSAAFVGSVKTPYAPTQRRGPGATTKVS